MIEEKTENSEEEEFYIYSGESYSDEEVESKINNSIHLIFFFWNHITLYSFTFFF